MSQKYNSEYVNENEAFFIGRNDIINRCGNVISHYLMLPGLIGFWPMATVQRSTGNVPNYAPTYTGATKQDLVYNGNPTFNYTATGVPYIALDGTGDYLSIADNTDLDILGTETQYVNPGLTMMGWFYSTANPGVSGAGLMGKLTTVGQYSYLMLNNSFAVNPLFYISVDGTNLTTVVSTITPGTNIWYFVAVRFVPSTSMDIYVGITTGLTKTTNAVGIPASIFNGTDAFEIGRYGGGVYHTGYSTLNSLGASVLSDGIIQSIFQQTRSLFGV